MPINYPNYKTIIVTASKNARNADSIDEALDIQAQGFADALAAAISEALVNTNVVTTGTAAAQSGTGVGTIT